jgi:hypothetical protein
LLILFIQQNRFPNQKDVVCKAGMPVCGAEQVLLLQILAPTGQTAAAEGCVANRHSKTEMEDLVFVGTRYFTGLPATPIANRKAQKCYL